MKRSILMLLTTLITACGAGFGERLDGSPGNPEFFGASEGAPCTSPGDSTCIGVGVMLYCDSNNTFNLAYWKKLTPASACNDYGSSVDGGTP